MENKSANTEGFPWMKISPEDGLPQRVILFYGQSGSGKTYISAQFPEPLILACDPGVLGGTLSARKFGPKVVKISSYDQLNRLIPTLKKTAGKEFKTLIIDSISYLQRTFMHGILRVVGREIPRYEEWNLLAERTRRFIVNVTELDCNVIFTATEKTDKDEITGKVFGGPNLTGKLAIELPQACDVVCRLFAVSSRNAKGERMIAYHFQSVPGDIWFARDRTETLPMEGVTNMNTFGALLEDETETQPTDNKEE